MTLVDVSSVSPALFVVGAVFIMLIFSLLSLGILKMFQLRFRSGWFSFGGAVISAVVFGIILNTWFV
ncbi:hypothetical protein DFQ01_104250 [Paenibacillus cellulosilyticus]|uniref:Uncharacterized protein n=1 Tax=Paenibacillus cellulosilyticus TaxID=375489 RepID=A0A2V2Z0F5_9BACL|nr:hypothetical protein [Paenibacillus cellulosilyticus]PWW05688.1 hypothetical protein DFQ01_104250 [Paenibacillus cellulosilyticus]QKS45292.1 hypothetical protein HUB94_13350 [Paenibacillus cellulosilyticus]